MNFAKYEKIIEETLSKRRQQHCFEVASLARELAQKYGADADKAYLCGIVHDIMKEKSYDELLQYCTNFDITLTGLEKSTYKLLHAIAGADYINRVLGIKDVDIINAVRYHTTARAGMSTLEKVVYLSDFTSADRDYDGVDKLRDAVQINIDEGLAAALRFSIDELLVRGNCYIHPDTLFAYNETVERLLHKHV